MPSMKAKRLKTVTVVVLETRVDTSELTWYLEKSELSGS